MLGVLIGGLALLISGVLALIKIWETFLLRPKITFDSDHVHGTGNTLVALRFYLTNTGRAATTVVEITFGDELTRGEAGWTTSESILARLPLRIGPGDATSPAFVVNLEPQGGFDDDLRAGKISRCFVRTVDRGWQTFPVRTTPGESYDRALPPGKREAT